MEQRKLYECLLSTKWTKDFPWELGSPRQMVGVTVADFEAIPGVLTRRPITRFQNQPYWVCEFAKKLFKLRRTYKIPMLEVLEYLRQWSNDRTTEDAILGGIDLAYQKSWTVFSLRRHIHPRSYMNGVLQKTRRRIKDFDSEFTVHTWKQRNRT